MSDDPREQIHAAEARLTALRSRRHRWLNRFAAAENVSGVAAERANCKSNLRLVDEAIVAAEAKLKAARHKSVVSEGREIEEGEGKMQNPDFGYFPPTPGMVLRTNATLLMEEVAKKLGLPTSMIRRGTILSGRAAEVFMASRNAEKMLEIRMVRYVRASLPKGEHHVA
jgi:hypothetical protein